MSDYIVHPRVGFATYNIHKFNGDDVPETTYIIAWNRGKPNCNCPAGTFRGKCKHIEYVRAYRKREALGDYNSVVAFCDE